MGLIYQDCIEVVRDSDLLTSTVHGDAPYIDNFINMFSLSEINFAKACLGTLSTRLCSRKYRRLDLSTNCSGIYTSTYT